MRKLLLFLLVLVWTGWGVEQFSDCQFAYPIKIDTSHIYKNNTNVPFVISEAGLQYLITTASDSGLDIVITDSFGDTIPRQIASFKKSDTTMQIWTTCPAIDTLLGGTQLYLQWGGTGRYASNKDIWTNPYGGTADYYIVAHGEETGANLIDASGNYTSTDANITYNQAGAVKRAPGFNGNNSSANWGDVAQFNSATKITISTWVTQAEIAAIDILCRKQVDASNRFGIQTYTGSVITVLVSNGGALSADFDYSDQSANTPFMLTVVYDGSLVGNDRLNLWTNKTKKAGSYTGAMPATLANLTTADFLVGQPSNAFNGKIDEFRVYNGALDSNITKFNYDNTSTFETNGVLNIGSIDTLGTVPDIVNGTMIPIHYGYLHGVGMLAGETIDSLRLTIATSDSGTRDIKLDSVAPYIENQLVVYTGNNGIKYVSPIQNVIDSTITLKLPIQCAIDSGSQVGSGYRNAMHMSTFAFSGFADWAVNRLENGALNYNGRYSYLVKLYDTTHTLIGDATDTALEATQTGLGCVAYPSIKVSCTSVGDGVSYTIPIVAGTYHTLISVIPGDSSSVFHAKVKQGASVLDSVVYTTYGSCAENIDLEFICATGDIVYEFTQSANVSSFELGSIETIQIDSTYQDIEHWNQTIIGDSWGVYLNQQLQTKLPQVAITGSALGGRTSVNIFNEFDNDVIPPQNYTWIMLSMQNDLLGPATAEIEALYTTKILHKCDSVSTTPIYIQGTIGEPADSVKYEYSKQYIYATDYMGAAEEFEAEIDSISPLKGKRLSKIKYFYTSQPDSGTGYVMRLNSVVMPTVAWNSDTSTTTIYNWMPPGRYWPNLALIADGDTIGIDTASVRYWVKVPELINGGL